MARDYRKEHLNYKGTPEQLKKNAARKRARYAMEKAGKAKPFDGKDTDHRNGNVMDNSLKNLRMTSPKANRSYPRTKTARKRNPKD